MITEFKIPEEMAAKILPLLDPLERSLAMICAGDEEAYYAAYAGDPDHPLASKNMVFLQISPNGGLRSLKAPPPVAPEIYCRSTGGEYRYVGRLDLVTGRVYSTDDANQGDNT